MTTQEPTDWEEVHRRINAIRTAIEKGFAPSPEEERRILKTRAQELAREPEGETAEEDTLEHPASA